MKNLMGITTMFLVLMGVTMVANAQTSDPAVRGAVAGHEVQFANLRIQLAESRIELGKVRARASVAKRLGDTALANDKKIEAKLVAEIARLEGMISNEVAKANAEVQEHALTTGENIIRVHLGAPDAPPAASTDPIAATTAVATALVPGKPAPPSAPLVTHCPANTSPRSFVAVGQGGTMGSYFACDPVVDLTAPAEKPRTVPLWLKYSAFIAGGAVVGGGATYLTNEGGDGNTSGWVTATVAAIGGVAGAGVCAVIELL